MAAASSTTSAPVTDNRCTSGGGNVDTTGFYGSTVTVALAPAAPVAAQIPANTCSHPCDGLYQNRRDQPLVLGSSRFPRISLHR